MRPVGFLGTFSRYFRTLLVRLPAGRPHVVEPSDRTGSVLGPLR
jgi:hypothetical protein